MNKGKYFKLKPSDAAHLKLDIKNFVIEHINLFAVKKEMEIIAKNLEVDRFIYEKEAVMPVL